MRFVLLVGAVVVGGVGVGAALERADVTSPIPEPDVAAPLYEAPYYSCPGESEFGTFHSGDRIFITGKTSDETMVEVRAPFDPSQRIRMWARHAVPDRDLTDLPAKACDDRREPAATTTTTTTEPPTTTTVPSTTTTVPSTTTTVPSTTTTVPPTTTTVPPTTTTEPPTTTTEPPADTTGPEISEFQATEADIWEADLPCAVQPQVTRVGAVISDPSGVSEVTLYWSVGSASGASDVPVLAPSVYGIDLGPFDTATLSGVDEDTFFLELVAVDGASNVSNVLSIDLVTLHDCRLR